MTWLIYTAITVGIAAAFFALRSVWMDMEVVRWFIGGPLGGTSMALPRRCKKFGKVVNGVQIYSYTKAGKQFIADTNIVQEGH